jgi:RsbT co-antagonist protein rsbRD N-terminal domain
MQTKRFLEEHQAVIVESAAQAIERNGMSRYRQAGPSEVRRRLQTLFTHLLRGVSERDVRPVAKYAEDIGEERFTSGYDLSDVQRAFNSLEEAIWACAFAELEPPASAETVRLVSAVLGAGKDALARRYLSLATQHRAPALDLQAMLDGAVAG